MDRPASCRHTLLWPACACGRGLARADPSEAEPAEADEQDRLERLTQLLELQRRVKNRVGRLSLAEFTKQAFAAKYPGIELEWGPHVDAICFHLQAQLEDRGRALKDKTFKMRAQNLLINAAPRSLKSFILVCACLWSWIHWPNQMVKYLSGNPDVALRAGRFIHELVESSWFRDTYRVPWTIRKDRSAPSDMANTSGGTFVACGIMASVVGEDATWLIIDDAHDVHDSEDKLAGVCERYDVSFHNRVDGDPRTGIRTVIMHRVRVSDLSAHLLRSGHWLHVRIPMHFQAKTQCACGTCVGRNIYGWQDWRSTAGEVIHPRFTPEFIEQTRARLALHHDAFEALMEQEPQDMSKAMVPASLWGFFRIRNHHAGDHPRPAGCLPAVSEHGEQNHTIEVDRFDEILMTIDCANADTTSGSRYALLVTARVGQRRFILDDGSRRGDLSQDIMPTLRALILRWRPRRLLVENKAAGPTMIGMLRAEIASGALKDEHGQSVICQVEAVGAEGGGGDKAMRMSVVLLILQARLVYLLEGAAWVKDFVAELAMFPRPPNDRGDALSQFLERVRGLGSGGMGSVDPNQLLRALTR